MSRRTRFFPIIFGVFVLAIFLLPQYVVAEVQTPVTEIVNLPSATNDNDQVVNPANATIRSNRDTWTPMPEGLFVGGTIEESKMQLNELPIDASTLLITTEVQFARTYLQNGASEFIVRLPVEVVHPDNVWYVKLEVWDITGESYPPLSFRGQGIYAMPPLVWVNTTLPYVAMYSDVANFWNHIGNPATEEIWTDVSHNSWLSDGRLYVRLVTPIFVDHRYLFSMRMTTNGSTPMVMYWHPSDLASDNITSSRVAYIWDEAVDQTHTRDQQVNADAGWSFMFQVGLGNTARDWDSWYPTNTVISWDKYVPVSSGVCQGGFTFIFEFRTNYTVDLNYDLTVIAENDTGGTDVTVLAGGDGHYWHDKMARDVIIAARPENITYPTSTLNGETVVHFSIQITVLSMLRLQMMLEADQQFLENNAVEIRDSDTTQLDKLWFSPWSTCLIQDSVYNETWEVAVKKTHRSAWTKVGHWWDEHWVDIANVLLLAGGMFLMAIPGGQVFGLALLAAGVGLFLYDNVPWIRDLVNAAIGLVIDGLKWLGNWLYKIGMAIWKALTWLVDQAIYFGGQLIALLIYGAAVIVPIFIITMVTKLMSMFYKIAKGDMTGAANEGREIVHSGTMGRVG